jgi:hypothetical protein
MNPWVEAFTIFARYPDGANVQAEHDEIWAGPDTVSADDKARLAELGWLPATEGGFHRYV